MMTNTSSLEGLAGLLQVLGQKRRLQILLAIGEGEVCVCHLEATFGWRQAYLSQHLSALREVGLVADRREGRFIFYRLVDARVLELLRQIAAMRGWALAEIPASGDCTCPHCSARSGVPA